MDLAGIASSKKARTQDFMGVIYLVTKKITVDNVAEGRGKLQAESNDERAHKFLKIAPGKPGDESFQSRAKGLSLVGHRSAPRVIIPMARA
jgi:hypothetical protein